MDPFFVDLNILQIKRRNCIKSLQKPVQQFMLHPKV